MERNRKRGKNEGGERVKKAMLVMWIFPSLLVKWLQSQTIQKWRLFKEQIGQETRKRKTTETWKMKLVKSGNNECSPQRQ